jgi:TonB family protein
MDKQSSLVMSGVSATLLNGIELSDGTHVFPGICNSFQVEKKVGFIAKNRDMLLFATFIGLYILYIVKPWSTEAAVLDDSQYDSMAATMFNFGDLVALKKKKSGTIYIEVDDVFGNQYVKNKEKKYDVTGEDDPRIGGAVNPMQVGNVTMPVDLNPLDTPKYTMEARAKGVEGMVTLEVVVGDDGSVLRVKVARGIEPSLDEAARKTYLRKKFQPSMGPDGKGVTVKFYQPVRFVLN